MSEDSRMDKKSLNRSTQPQPRASAIDCRKGTDSTHKPWPRNNNKKRDGGGGAPKNEVARKPVPCQRGGRGAVDRRPRPRGSPGYAVGGTQNTGLEEEDEPEIGSVFVPGSKKQNLNHLLNFMYPARGAESRGAERRGPPRRHQRVSFKHEHDLYLRAYCQFVVKESGDYKANLLDPDYPLKWELIEELVVRSTGRSECPICLGAPVAARAGLCAHVYCWACALHYAAAHERAPPPCPVCAAPLHVPDMKPARVLQWDGPADQVTMCLVRRLRGSTTVEVAPARGQQMELTPDNILPLHCINDAPYCKLFSANKQQVQDILEREKREIEAQILAEIDTTEIVFMEQALKMLETKKLATMGHDTPKIVEVKNDEVPIIYEKQEVNGNKIDWFDVNEDGAAVDVVQNELENMTLQSNLNPEAAEFQNFTADVNVTELPLTEVADTSENLDNDLPDIDKQNQAKYFYFYQAADGQQVFLNSLNVRLLTASWGSLAAAPRTLTARVLHRETLPLTEQTRKHMPCTAHLPLHCSFDIVEIDLQPPYVTLEALQTFADEIDRRARNRARAEREERRRERAYRRAMEGPPKPDFSSDLVFPQPYCPPEAVPPGPSLSEPSPLAAEAGPSTSIGSPPSSLSFAKMASTSGTWRVRKAVTPPPPPPEEDGGGPRALCLSDAIEAALLATSTAPKKNKKKQKLLFTTGVQRSA